MSTSMALSRGMESEHTSRAGFIHDGINDLALALGMEDESVLHKQAHKRLATQLQELAAMQGKLDIKVQATTKATKTLVEEMRRRQANGAAEVAAAGEEVSMDFFLQRMSASVSAAMEGADEKVLQSKRYKGLMKHVTTIQGEDDDDDIIVDRGNKVSLICPITSAKFRDPVQSKACKHTFEKDAIFNHIRIAKNAPVACPVAGCVRKVKSQELVPDEAMMRRLRIESQTEQTGPPIDAEEIDDSVGETYI